MKIMYTIVDRLVLNGKELEVKNRIRGSKPDIVGLVEIRLNKEKI